MKSRSGIQVMAGLIGMIRPLLSKMCLAVLMGCVGNLMATFITVLGAYGLTTLLGLTGGLKLSVIFTLLAVFSVRAVSCGMRSRQATTTLHLNCLQKSVIRYLRHCES